MTHPPSSHTSFITEARRSGPTASAIWSPLSTYDRGRRSTLLRWHCQPSVGRRNTSLRAAPSIKAGVASHVKKDRGFKVDSRTVSGIRHDRMDTAAHLPHQKYARMTYQRTGESHLQRRLMCQRVSRALADERGVPGQSGWLVKIALEGLHAGAMQRMGRRTRRGAEGAPHVPQPSGRPPGPLHWSPPLKWRPQCCPRR